MEDSCIPCSLYFLVADLVADNTRNMKIMFSISLFSKSQSSNIIFKNKSTKQGSMNPFCSMFMSQKTKLPLDEILNRPLAFQTNMKEMLIISKIPGDKIQSHKSKGGYILSTKMFLGALMAILFLYDGSLKERLEVID